MTTLIIGASRGPGRLFYDQLRQRSQPVTGIARQRGNVETGDTARFIELDAADAEALADRIEPGTTLIHCGPPQVLRTLLRQASAVSNIERLVALGSTRLFSRYPDAKQRRVAALANAIEASELAATLIHPTMIYGGPGLNNIERIINIAGKSPLVPLPARGRSLIQPVFAGDVVMAIQRCLEQDSTIGRTFILPGPSPLTYREFVEQCIRAAGLRARVVPVPYLLLRLAAPFTRLLPGLPTITGQEVERLLEDKDFDPTDIVQALDLPLTPLDEGLRIMLKSASVT